MVTRSLHSLPSAEDIIGLFISARFTVFVSWERIDVGMKCLPKNKHCLEHTLMPTHHERSDYLLVRLAIIVTRFRAGTKITVLRVTYLPLYAQDRGALRACSLGPCIVFGKSLVVARFLYLFIGFSTSALCDLSG